MSQKSASAKDDKRPPSKGGISKNRDGFLARQASNKSPVVKEADLLSKKDPITPEDVMGLEVATKGKRYFGFC